jgi:hypothetical protein
MTNKEYADSLRLIADFYEANPDFPQPIDSHIMRIWKFEGKEGLAEFVRLVGGKCEKHVDETFFTVSRKFGSITMEASDYRSRVCEKIVVGKKLVKRSVPIGYREEIVEEEEVQWKCPPALLDNTIVAELGGKNLELSKDTGEVFTESKGD